jgi:hypothetical protein
MMIQKDGVDSCSLALDSTDKEFAEMPVALPYLRGTCPAGRTLK